MRETLWGLVSVTDSWAEVGRIISNSLNVLSPKEYSHPGKGSQDPDTHKENQRWTKGNRLQKGLRKGCGRKTLTDWQTLLPPRRGARSRRISRLLTEGAQYHCGSHLGQEAVLAVWTRTAANARMMEAAESSQETQGVQWGVVHAWQKPPPQTQMMGSLVIPCWTSLGSWATRESECLLLVPCLQFSSVLYPMHSEEWCVKWKLTVRLVYQEKITHLWL